MISIDTNVLLYSLNPDSIWHEAAVDFLRQNLGVPSVRIAITDYVLVELYVLLRNPAVMAKPLSAQAARDVVTAYLDAPNVKGVGPTHSHILQAYLGLNPEFWPTYAVAVSIIRPALHDAEARKLS